ncbi:MAG: ATP-binding cassette domain-containing protein [Clostridia bacterium]|nr:ATP-binding cassette domain-containing protein [Clostridia bacterium]
MNAIEIRNLVKHFGEKTAVAGLDMTVPMGAIYGFIGENGSGKSTTEKIICGLVPKNSGSIKLYGRDYTDEAVRSRIGVLIEAPVCFGNLTVWDNMMLEAKNLSIKNPEREIIRVLKTVRMEGAAGNKYKNCSLGMKQRVGIAMALLGDPMLLVLDEPLNGLDADGMRIMREVFLDIVKGGERTIVVSSHLLGELQKVATHYGIIRHGKMIIEMTSEQLDNSCPTYVSLRAENMAKAKLVLATKYSRVLEDEAGYLRVYDMATPEEIITYLYKNSVLVTEIVTDKIGLEEYYIDLMKGGLA